MPHGGGVVCRASVRHIRTGPGHFEELRTGVMPASILVCLTNASDLFVLPSELACPKLSHMLETCDTELL